MHSISIYFDGGSNYEDGYGSWDVVHAGVTQSARRVPFYKYKVGENVTNNVAEYMALIGGLTFLDSISNKKDCHVKISGDSQLVLNQVSGKFKCKSPHLKKYLLIVLTKLAPFASFHVEWKNRTHSVKRFGH